MVCNIFCSPQGLGEGQQVRVLVQIKDTHPPIGSAHLTQPVDQIIEVAGGYCRLFLVPQIPPVIVAVAHKLFRLAAVTASYALHAPFPVIGVFNPVSIPVVGAQKPPGMID